MSWTRNSEAARAADPALIRARAIDLLARREHSRLELRQKLAQRGFPAEHLDPVLDQLLGLLGIDVAQAQVEGRMDCGAVELVY